MCISNFRGNVRRALYSATIATSLFIVGSIFALSQHEGHHAPTLKPSSSQSSTNNKSSTKKRPKPSSTRRNNVTRQNSRKRASTTQQRGNHLKEGMDEASQQDRKVIRTYETQPTSKVTDGSHTQAGEHDHHQHMQSQPAQTNDQTVPSSTEDHNGHQTTQSPQSSIDSTQQDQQAGPVMRLEDLEAMALKNNPTLAQAVATIRAAEGRRRQAGLLPNPVIGYFGEELSFRALSQTSEHGIFVEQRIPLGGKLSKSKQIFAREREQAEIQAEAQKQRVLNSIRVLYFDALGAQRLVELRTDLARLSREAAEVSEELFNVGQADKPDLFEIQIEAQRAEIDRLKALSDREQVWRLLAAMVGNPELKPTRLVGNLEEGISTLNQETLLTTLLRESPEIKSAQVGVERARAVLARAKAERAPDLFLRGGIAYNNEILDEDNRKIGPEAVLEAGISVPIFNRNQGGIAAAQAELEIAERELQRLQLTLRTRLALSFREYSNASQVVEKYRTQVVPKARTAYEMYLSNFKQMAASYPQVLIAQRTLFQVQVEYSRSLIALRQSMIGLRGFLLTGGLEAINGGERAGEPTGEFTLGSGNESSSDSDNE
jgi:outer membrane protein, heavy metal efflux system